MNSYVNSSSKKGDGKNKKFRFNFIDFLIIVLILAIIAAVVYIFVPLSWLNQNKGTVDLQYYVEFQGVDEAFIENIEENDVLIDSVSKNVIGKVVAVDYNTQHSVLKYDEANGEGVLSVIPEKYNLIVTISTANAVYKDGEGYSVNSCRIAVGEKINARFPDYAAEGYCIGLD